MRSGRTTLMLRQGQWGLGLLAANQAACCLRTPTRWASTGPVEQKESRRHPLPAMAQRGVAFTQLAELFQNKRLLGALSLDLPTALGQVALGPRRRRLRLPADDAAPRIDLRRQSRQLADGSRISALNVDGQLQSRLAEHVHTLYDVVRHGATRSADAPMLGHRERRADGSEPFVWRTYGQVLAQTADLAQAFRRLGLGAGPAHHVAVFCRNRPEWIITEHAAYTFSNVIVPLYETLGPASTAFILNQSETELLVCDDMEKAYRILEERQQCPNLKYIVVVDKHTVTDHCRQIFANDGLTIYTFDEMLELGRTSPNPMPAQPPTKDTLATICYTSGTTGTPKGVMLTHGNIMADMTCHEYVKCLSKGGNEVMISFLPMAHMYERLLQNVIFYQGASVGFWRGKLPDLMDDIRELKPTCMPCVPRVLNRIYDRVWAEVNQHPLSKLVFSTALMFKERQLQNGIMRHDTLLDKLVFRRVKDLLGGRVSLMITGSAPISTAVLNFSRSVFGCHVLEGYGQTECVAAVTLSLANDTSAGHVGAPLPCAAVKLVDVPEMNYFASEGRGEICIRGANVTPGYYKNPEETRKILDEEGWLRTGDVGMWRENGTLQVIDRKKHIFKLAQGEYVAPEKIENVYVRSPFVAQIYVHGDSLENALVAVVHPDPAVLVPEAERRLGLSGLSVDELCQRADVRDHVLADMRQLGEQNGLHSFEQVKDIHLTSEAFTIENDLLTPTLKARRPNLQKHFAKDIADMYAKTR